MPPDNKSEDKAFRWRREDAYVTVTGPVFAKLVHENGLKVEGPFDGFYYAMKHTTEGEELYRCPGPVWDATASSVTTSTDPAAGATGATALTVAAGKREIIQAVSFTYVRDVNAADVYFYCYFSTAGGAIQGASATATALTANNTGYITFVKGGSNTAQTVGTNQYICAPLPDIELSAGSTVSLTFLNKAATDNCSVIYSTVKVVDA